MVYESRQSFCIFFTTFEPKSDDLKKKNKKKKTITIFVTLDKNFMLLLTRQCASLTNVAKQYMNVMTSMFSAFKHIKRWGDKKKKKKFRQINIIFLQNVPYILTRKFIPTLDSFAQKQRR